MARPASPVTITQPDDLADDEWDRIMAEDVTSSAPSLSVGLHVSDAFGVLWEVWDSRVTSHDFAIYLGRAAPVTGLGGATVIPCLSAFYPHPPYVVGGRQSENVATRYFSC